MMKNSEKVLVMGAGHQGLTMAAHLLHNGVKCNLWNRTLANVSSVIETGFIECEGIFKASVAVDKISDRIEEVIEKIILVTTPSSAHRDIAKVLAPYVDDTYTIVLNPGRTFGILEFTKTLMDNGCQKMPVVAETQSIVYTCRRNEKNGIILYAIKDGIKLSTLQQEDAKEVIEKLPHPIRRNFVPAETFLETSFGNVGMILHCLPVLLNVGWIESKKTCFEYYYDGISKSIADILEKMDQERIQVARGFGCNVETLIEWMQRVYKTSGETLYENLQTNKYYAGIDAPQTLHHRYLEEDVPNGLVAIESAGQHIGQNTSIMTLVIDLANLVMNTDYRKSGRNYDDLISTVSLF
ncbi:MAG: NAD/NADP octopine/nopaline dehydrogenase family protein [bacterium]|nr:NAD/NADP octopine/nopaline dehydrogenase family protein [bacterium]